MVQGTVTDPNNRKLSGLLVKAFDRDMRSEALLGESLTDAKGEYRIEYSQEQFNLAEKRTATLSMKVFAARGDELLYKTEIEQIVFKRFAIRRNHYRHPVRNKSRRKRV